MSSTSALSTKYSAPSMDVAYTMNSFAGEIPFGAWSSSHCPVVVLVSSQCVLPPLPVPMHTAPLTTYTQALAAIWAGPVLKGPKTCTMPLSALVVRTWIMAVPPPGSVDGVTCAVRIVFSGKPNCGHWLIQVVQEAAAELPPQQTCGVQVNEVLGPLGPTASNP